MNSESYFNIFAELHYCKQYCIIVLSDCECKSAYQECKIISLKLYLTIIIVYNITTRVIC